MTKYDVIIIGSGPSALMCSSFVKNKQVLILEKNSDIGGKIKVSGGGRCNVTNNKEISELLLNTTRNPKFLYSTLTKFGPKDIINFFESHNLKLKEENNNRMFPVTDSSQSVLDVFQNIINSKNITVKTNFCADKIDYQKNTFYINDIFSTKYLIIATGGKSYSHLGTTGDGYTFAEQFGHFVITPIPVESPLVSNDEIIQSKKLQGIALSQATCTAYSGSKMLFQSTDDVLITHFGISGPAALKASYYFKMELLNNKNDLSFIIDCQELYLNKTLPKKIKDYLDDEFKLIFKIHDTRGFKNAFLTAGGIKVSEISPKTFESKKIENLFFIGEVLDINAFTGGYNLTNFFSQGYSVASYLNTLD